jgi:hypothetical protein
VRTAPTAPPRRRAGSVLTRCDSGDCITCPANASAHPRCSVMPRGANTVCPGGLRFGHHPSKHMAPHAAGALHERTQVCSRHADRQGHSGRTPHVNDDRVGEACVCLADSPGDGALACTAAARAVGPAHAPRVAMRNYAQKDCARAQRPERAHACCRPPAALRACVERRHERAGRTTPPTKAAHPLAAVVHEGVSPAAAPASRPARPRILKPGGARAFSTGPALIVPARIRRRSRFLQVAPRASAGPAKRPWSPAIAQQRLLAVINGECCFNCFKSLADYETHFCPKCFGRGQDVPYCSKECREKHWNTHRETCAITRGQAPTALKNVAHHEALD